MCILSVLSYASAGILGTPYADNGGYADNSPLPYASAPSGLALGPAPHSAVLSQPILAPQPQQIISAGPPQEIRIVVQEPQQPAPIHILPAPIALAPAPAPEVRIIKIIRQLAPQPQQPQIRIIKVLQQQQASPPPARIIRIIEEPRNTGPELIKVIRLHANPHHSQSDSHGPIKIVKIINAGHGGQNYGGHGGW